MEATPEQMANQLKTLSQKRSQIKERIEEIAKELHAQNLGGLDQLLDTPDGYPRHDIDVYRTCELRGEFHRLNNDFKQYSAEAEELLKRYFNALKN